MKNFLNKVTLKKLGRRPAVLVAVPCGADNASIKKFEKVHEAKAIKIIKSEVEILAIQGKKKHPQK